MPIYKDKSRNTWFVVINHRVDGKNKASYKRGFATKREAVAYEKEALLEGNYAHTDSSFRAMLEEQMDSAEVSEQSKKDKRNALKNHFPYLDTHIEKITKANLSKWRINLKDEDLSVTFKNQIMGMVKSVFNYAERIYSLPNPSGVLDNFKKTSDDVQEMKIWTPEQFEQFIPFVEHPVFRAYFTLLFWTGMRRSEAAALCKEDVDFGNNTISINKNLSSRDVTKFTRLKSKYSKRVIQVDSVTMDMLKPLYETAEPYIFANDAPVITSNISQVWKKAVTESGLEYIRIHDLRHSHASWLIANGVNIVAVSKRLGHSSIDITLKTYTHLLESTNNQMMEKIEQFRKV